MIIYAAMEPPPDTNQMKLDLKRASLSLEGKVALMTDHTLVIDAGWTAI